jgi:phosphate transport system permease protein
MLARLGGSGQSLLAATLVLALMILPTIALTSSAALRSVPREQIEGAAALGLERWAIAVRVALPAARGGVVAGLVLAASRAVGETMAVVMLAGNVPQLPSSLVSPVRTLTGNIALEMGYATESHRAVLFVSGLVLLGTVLAAVILAEIIKGSSR